MGTTMARTSTTPPRQARDTRSGGRRPAPAVTRRQSARRIWLGVSALVLVGMIAGAVVFVRRGDDRPGALGTIRAADAHALTVSPVDPNVAFFGHHNGVQRSTDGGRTWRALQERAGLDAMGLAVSSANPNQIVIAGHGVLQSSQDGGTTWQPIAHNLPGTDLHGFALDPDDPNRMTALVAGRGLFQSGDGGRTWQPLTGQAPADIMTLASAGGAPATLYATSMAGGLVRSTDGGATWSRTGNGIMGMVSAIAVDPAARRTLYAGAASGLYKSIDGGTNWTRLAAYPGANVTAVAVGPAGSGVVLAVAGGDGQALVYRSDDGGATWAAR